ncbi:MAG: glucose/mannose-6-phosphate isomerase [Actinomycetota bacterium]|nr:glucose/mannose-6-phosphate isomerase [Actinomycetota bacterium]
MTATARPPSDRKTLDTQGILHATLRLPEQVAEAMAAGHGLEGLPDHDDIENIVVLGMGGSALAGDILVAAAGPFLPVPALALRGYNVPAFVGDGTLVFAVSFSGDTEETVEAVTEAALAGARVVAITTGGELARLAEAWEVPIVRIPPGIPQPRCGLGALSIPALAVLEDIGLFPGATAWVHAAVEQLKIRRDQLLKPGNVAQELARAIGRTIPVIHGGGPVGAAAAYRWKSSMNENAKVPAFWNTQPELCHNEVSGWGQHGDVTRQVMTLVGLRHDFEHPQVMHRFELTYQLLDEVVAGIEEVQAEGEGELAQLLDLILVGDVTSIELALQEGIDPGPIPAQDHIKNALATSAGERNRDPEDTTPRGTSTE